MKRPLKSRTFAVMVQKGPGIEINFVYRRVELDGQKRVVKTTLARLVDARDREKVSEVLQIAGLTVRGYDEEKKQWFDQSEQFGLEPVVGSENGSWNVPSVEEFERDYTIHL